MHLTAIVSLSLILFVGLAGPQPVRAEGRFFSGLQERLASDGFDLSLLSILFSRPEVSFEMDGVAGFFRHSEDRVNYDQYLDPQLIERGRAYLDLHRQDFDRTEAAYGVDRGVVTAILLVETQLGTRTGRRLIFNSLATMAALKDAEARERLWARVSETSDFTRKEYDQKAGQRSEWAYRELKAFLAHVTEQGFDPLSITGSYAGAMGFPQFMPGNINGFARDGDADGRVDLFSHPDAIASVAAYLQHHGWKPGLKGKKAEKVVHHYNHSDRYVETILKIARKLKG